MNTFVAEIIGTLILILLGDGVVANVVLAKTKGNGGGGGGAWILINVGWGMAVFTAVYVVGFVSGAHINPAVTIGLAVAGLFPWASVGPYIVAQMIGAFLGAVLVWLAYLPHWAETDDPGLKLAVFSTGPAIRSYGPNLLCETIGTWMLVFGVFGIKGVTGDPSGAAFNIDMGALGAIPVGLLVLVIGTGLGGPTGYAINPARDLGPRIAHAVLPIPGKGDSDWGYSWVPVVGPIIGAIIAAVMYLALGAF